MQRDGDRRAGTATGAGGRSRSLNHRRQLTNLGTHLCCSAGDTFQTGLASVTRCRFGQSASGPGRREQVRPSYWLAVQRNSHIKTTSGANWLGHHPPGKVVCVKIGGEIAQNVFGNRRFRTRTPGGDGRVKPVGGELAAVCNAAGQCRGNGHSDRSLGAGLELDAFAGCSKRQIGHGLGGQ